MAEYQTEVMHVGMDGEEVKGHLKVCGGDACLYVDIPNVIDTPQIKLNVQLALCNEGLSDMLRKLADTIDNNLKELEE